ncbi:MAG: hypothetical protein M1296_07025 [Chloroflexi bacterium]|nr:hypothetical protein [Chloroflexota bacterium]
MSVAITLPAQAFFSPQNTPGDQEWQWRRRAVGNGEQFHARLRDSAV